MTCRTAIFTYVGHARGSRTLVGSVLVATRASRVFLASGDVGDGLTDCQIRSSSLYCHAMNTRDTYPFTDN